MEQAMKDKLLMLLEKVGLPTELTDQVKSALSNTDGKEVKVEVDIESGNSKPLTIEEVDKMSPEAAKEAFKKHLETCMKEKSSEDKQSLADKMKKMMY